jgi:flagellum-specific ATP synthase
VAEHFRSTGRQVLLLLDSVTRFAMAQREIGLSSGEPPTTKGYPPTVFSELPHLLERAGPGREGEGDITAIYTVLVDGDDMNEPIADAIRGIVDGHMVLDRAIAERGRYPAINIQKSISRMLPACHTDEEYTIMNEARRALARYADMEDLIRVGAYKPGADPEVDAAMRFAKVADRFLSQRKSETMMSDQSFAELYRMLLEAGIDVPIDVNAVDQPASAAKKSRPVTTRPSSAMVADRETRSSPQKISKLLSEQRHDVLRRLVRHRDRLCRQLLLYLNRLQTGRLFFHIRINHGRNTRI